MAVIDAEAWATPEVLGPPLRLMPEVQGDDPCPFVAYSGPDALSMMQAFLDAEDTVAVAGGITDLDAPSVAWARNLRSRYNLLLETVTEESPPPPRRATSVAAEQAVAQERLLFDMAASRAALRYAGVSL